MARSLWTGSLSFGLVNVPMVLISAVRDLDLHFRQLHAADGAPIEVQRWCSEEEREVPYEEITRAYECEDSRQVLVSDLELEAIEPRKTRTIDIEQFVCLDEIDPIYFDHPYLLLPANDNEGALRAYRLLAEVMGRTERAAVGRFVMRAKEYLAIVRERDELLTLTTMVFADEVRSTEEIDAATGPAHKPTARQLNAAVAVIEELSCAWDPGKHEDRYRARLREVVARKRKGETVKAPAAEALPAAPPDLMQALERTLAELTGEEQNGKGKSGAGKGGRGAQQTQAAR